MKLEKFFRQHPVFTNKEFAAFLRAEGSYNIRTQESLLDYHRRSGRIMRVRRGLYAVLPFGANPDSYPVDPFLLTARMTDDAVLAYHTALEFHGRAYSVYEHYFYLTGHSPRPFTFRSLSFRSALFPRKLRIKDQQNFGVMVADRTGLDVRVTGLERTLVDVLDRPDLTGSWEEIWRSLELVEFFNLDVVVEYVSLLDNATTAARVGFFLEQHRKSLMVQDVHLKALQKLRPRQPHYFDRARRKDGRLVKQWNLVVPSAVMTRSWAEVT
jgi:predicted transcriptional regulator of viral defense system